MGSAEYHFQQVVVEQYLPEEVAVRRKVEAMISGCITIPGQMIDTEIEAVQWRGAAEKVADLTDTLLHGTGPSAVYQGGRATVQQAFLTEVALQTGQCFPGVPVDAVDEFRTVTQLLLDGAQLCVGNGLL